MSIKDIYTCLDYLYFNIHVPSVSFLPDTTGAKVHLPDAFYSLALTNSIYISGVRTSSGIIRYFPTIGKGTVVSGYCVN